ncbi:MAG: DUF3857 domain-containing protein [Candidatus Omnitrophota bacterium]|jgi:tetratricopeptide (TPR) repeat protein|nr:MAG: DUF3857 domain-containing protein [Candidatus Omnitrophota bacterium]
MMKKLSFTLHRSVPSIAVLLFLCLCTPAGFTQTGEDVWLDFFQHNNLDQTLISFAQAVKNDAEDAMAYAGFGLLGPSRGMNREALNNLLKAVEVGYYQPAAALFLSEAMRMTSGRNDYEKIDQFIANLLNEADDVPEYLRSLLLFHQARMKQKLGLWEEASVLFASLHFVTQFRICGPFDNAEKGGHNRIFGPEEQLDFQATYPGRRGEVGWRSLPLNPDNGYINLHALIDPSNESTTYLAAVIVAEKEQRCQLRFGHAGALKVWLNGTLEADMARYHGAQLDQVNIDARFDEGENTLLVKISSGKQGNYGLFTRLNANVPDQIRIIPQQEMNPSLDLSNHAPTSQQESPPTFQLEPIPIRQLKALGEGPEAKPYHHLFYALLLQRLDIADENDHSANTMLSKLGELYPGNAYLVRQMGESEKQDNLRRLGYAKALELDPADPVSFLLLLDYYRKSPYATKGYELIRQWEKKHAVPAKAKLMQAQMWSGTGMREAAVELIRSITDETGVHGKWNFYEIGNSFLTDDEQETLLREILQEDAYRADALHALRRLAIRTGKEASIADLLQHERRIDPFSIAGQLDLVKYHQTENDYQKSLKLLQQIQEISPAHFEAHTLSAIAYHALDEDEKALAALNAALVARPSDPWCLEYRELIQPQEDNYASPYLREWKDIAIPETLDLSKANYVTLLNQKIVKVHQNGNSSETVREIIKILTDTGIRMQRVRGIYYDTGSSEEVRIVRARVWKPDGTFYDAPAAERRSASSSSDAANRLYLDYYVAIVRFPALEKGSIVELEYKKEQKGENIYADYYGDLFFIGNTDYEPTVHSDYVLLTPKTREFFYNYNDHHYPASVSQEHVDIMRTPEISESADEKIHRWTFGHLPAIPREPLMPFASEILPYIKISTFKTWSDMTNWYWNLIREQLKPGTVLKQKVKDVVNAYRQARGYNEEQILGPWDLVRAVNSFVNTEVRYLGLEFGIHGYKPHKVDEICNAQYGDCKDKAALAVTMLTELGIEAYIVLIRTTDRGEIDLELPSLGVFNHAIYYIPDLEGKEYWIDGTATFYDATELPAADAGANTLIIRPDGAYEFKRIPHTTARENGGKYTTVLTLDADGNGKGIHQVEFSGLYNPIIRRTFENTAKAKEIVDRSLVTRYPGSQSSNLELSDLRDYSTAEYMSYEVEIPQFAVKQGMQWVMPATLFEEQISQRYAQLSSREFDLVLSLPWMKMNNISINLPEKHGKTILPPDRDARTEFGYYLRTTKQEENRIVIREELVCEPVRVPKDRYQEFREFCRLVDLYQVEKIYIDFE